MKESRMAQNLSEPKSDILCSYPEWSVCLIEQIDNDAFVNNHDLCWITSDGEKHDYSSVYISNGGFLEAAVRHAAVSDGKIQISVTGHLADPVLLRCLRIYMHTGIVVLEHNEPFTQLYNKYNMCNCYHLVHASAIIEAALRVKIDCTGVLTILSDCAGTEAEETELFLCATQYFKRHAHDCLKKLNTTYTQRLSESCFSHIMDILGDDDVNLNEYDILNEMFTLCLKRCKQDSRTAVDLFLSDDSQHLSETEQPTRKRKYQRIRPTGLSFEDIMIFKEKHGSAFSPEFYMELLAEIWKYDKDKSLSAKPPRKFQSVSHYPQNLRFPNLQSTCHVYTTLSSLNYTVSYLAVPLYRSGASVDVPPFLSAGSQVLTMQILYQNKHVSALGGLNTGVTTYNRNTKLTTVELKVINFCRDRIKRSEAAVDIKPNSSFSIPQIILLATLTDNDYTFEPKQYPVIAPGNYILIKVTTTLTAEKLETERKYSV